MKLFIRKNTVWVCLIIAAVIALVAGLFIPAGEEGHEFWWSHLFIFFAVLGFAGCVAIIYVAKWLGHYWLQRKEDYYD